MYIHKHIYVGMYVIYVIYDMSKRGRRCSIYITVHLPITKLSNAGMSCTPAYMSCSVVHPTQRSLRTLEHLHLYILHTQALAHTHVHEQYRYI